MIRIIMLSCIFITVLISCNKNIKSEKIENGKIIKSNNTNKLTLEFSNDDVLLRILHPSKGYEVIFYGGDVNRIGGILFQKGEILETIDFSDKGEFEKYVLRDDKLNERFYVTNYDDFLEYSVFKKFSSDKYLVPIINLNISKNNLDTFNFFYYRPVKNGFQILTDSSYFNYDNKLMDSMVIKYVEHKLQDKYFFSPEPNLTMPDVEKFKNKKVINNLFIPTKSKIVIGTLWTFFNPEKVDHGPYSYQMIYFDGDIMSRMKQYDDSYKTYRNKYYSSKMIDNREIVDDLVESGYFKLEGNKLVRDKTGE